jgi:urease accessory protein
VSGSRVQGYLRIECRPDGSGRTFLSRQSFRAPIHLSKPHWDGSHLIINLVNPTAGLFAGDHLEVAVQVCAGARAVLTSSSAARVFRAKHPAQRTEILQDIVVEGGGRLDVFPEMLIPHGGARYLQSTNIDVHAGGELFFTEALAPGRTASGETFDYDSLAFSTNLVVSGRLALSERYCLESGSESLRPLRRRFPNAYYASALIVSQSATGEAFQREIDALNDTCVVAGASQPAENVCAIKILAANSLSLRAAITKMRTLGYAHLGGPEPILRKL